MKKPLLLIPLLGSLFLVACPADESAPLNGKQAAPTRNASSQSSENEETEPSKVRPHKGMTKAQVRKLYGDPDNQQVTSSGETWSYFFNRGHYFIPYYFGKPRTGTFHFNEAGILTDFEYNQED
jgi:outer membrane protein assembly factor BamE (lipoprotein component of BamABCDE complex)